MKGKKNRKWACGLVFGLKKIEKDENKEVGLAHVGLA